MKPPLLYLHLVKILKEKSHTKGHLDKTEFSYLVGVHLHLPREQRLLLLRELIDMGLIEDLGTTRSHSIKILV